jgi:transposase
MEVYILGVDVAKAKFDVCLLWDERAVHRVFPNNANGFAALKGWLRKRGTAQVHACMEATGRYWEALAIYLHQAGQTVSVVNPRRVKSFWESELQRQKTDRVDAAVIARFCRAAHPRPWTPPPAELRELQEMVRRLDALKRMQTQEKNRLSNPGISPLVQAGIGDHLAYLQGQIKETERAISEHINSHPLLKGQRDLLTSIPGIGKITAALLLGELGEVGNYKSGRQVAAHAGLTPKQFQSGSSVKGKPRLSKMGNVHLRKGLYMCAVVAKHHNPIIKAFCHRLLAAGKPTMLVVAAAMRKLLLIAFAVLKSQTPFNPNYLPCPA